MTAHIVPTVILEPNLKLLKMKMLPLIAKNENVALHYHSRRGNAAYN